MSATHPEIDVFDEFEKSELNNIADAIYQARATDLQVESSNLLSNSFYYKGKPYYWPGGGDKKPAHYHELSPTESEVVEQFCESNNVEFVGAGSGRIAIRFGDSVIKFGRWGVSPNMGQGRKMNIRESSIYRCLGEGTDLPLLPIYQHEKEGRWVVQEYAKPLAKVDQEVDLISIQERMKQRLTELRYIIHYDLTTKNIGFWDDDWYLIDFAKRLDDLTDNDSQEIN